MTKIIFHRGLTEIGGTFISVETEKAKCMFDFGFSEKALTDPKIKKRNITYIQDYLSLGILPKEDGIYEQKVTQDHSLIPFGETTQECFILISHMHIDHMGALGMLHDKMPVYMSMDSKRLYDKLGENHEIEYHFHENCIGLPFEKELEIGDIKIKIIEIDHDVVGASGFILQTPDGSICYTGDYRFHGFHPDKSENFAIKSKGVDVLITEGVTVSFQDVDMLSLEKPEEPARTEKRLQSEMIEYAKNETGLIVINPYNRNIERLHYLNQTLAESGRILVMDEIAADYVKEFYPEDILHVYHKTTEEGMQQGNWKYITQKDLLENPMHFVLQLDYKDMLNLIDLSKVVSLYVHMDGAPLGDYDPSYDKMIQLLQKLDIPYTYKGIGGHANPYYIKWMIDTIEPQVLVPLHSMRPEQVVSDKVGKRFLPKKGECIILPLSGYSK